MALHPVVATLVKRARVAVGENKPVRSVIAFRETLEANAAAFGMGPDISHTFERTIDGRAGAIGIRIYVGSESPSSVIVYAHGGGWIGGNGTVFDAFARALALRSNSTVLLVDYALAPEAPFPRGLEDIEDVLLWARESVVTGKEHGTTFVNPGALLTAAGDSSGANLVVAAVATLGTRVAVDRTVLIHPVTDNDFGTASYRDFGQGLLFGTDDMRWFFENYAPAELWADPRISVMRASLAGFPRTFVVTAAYDALRDDGETLAQKLTESGVETLLRRYPGVIHGFLRMFNIVDTADRALDEIAKFIQSGEIPPLNDVEGAHA